MVLTFRSGVNDNVAVTVNEWPVLLINSSAPIGQLTLHPPGWVGTSMRYFEIMQFRKIEADNQSA